MDLRLGDWADVLADVEVDALITDTPYSDRTHGAYREMAAMRRNPIPYERWTPGDVHRFVAHWSARTRGWLCSLTDHILARAWEDALQDAGRYVFAPVACVQPGSTVRLVGDGPAQWSTWLIAARPRTREYATWGALPGAYVVPRGHNRRRTGAFPGSKPLWLMRQIVRDYSRPGDLVCDPCAGCGTTLRAAIAEGRRAIGAEVDPDTHARALGLVTAETERGQLSLLEARR